jgi:hypothetical protein
MLDATPSSNTIKKQEAYYELYNLGVLSLVYNSQNHCICGLCPSSGILNNYKTFRELDLVLSSAERREAPTLLVLSERGNLT